MRRKKTKQNVSFRNFCSPYETPESRTMTEWYEVYKGDREKEVDLDGQIYRKIIWRADGCFYDEPALLVAFEPAQDLHLGDVLTDEDGREFTVKHFAMFSYAGGIPEWHLKVMDILLQGQDNVIGKYLCKRAGEAEGVGESHGKIGKHTDERGQG